MRALIPPPPNSYQPLFSGQPLPPPPARQPFAEVPSARGGRSHTAPPLPRAPLAPPPPPQAPAQESSWNIDRLLTPGQSTDTEKSGFDIFGKYPEYDLVGRTQELW
jgi:hypothetical protein